MARVPALAMAASTPCDSRSEVVLPALSCSIMRTSSSARATKSGSVSRYSAASSRAMARIAAGRMMSRQ